MSILTIIDIVLVMLMPALYCEPGHFTHVPSQIGGAQIHVMNACT